MAEQQVGNRDYPVHGPAKRIRFPSARVGECVRLMTTRVYHPGLNQTRSISNVLVPRTEDDYSSDSSSDDSMEDIGQGEEKEQRAYWLQRTLMEAIYGRVCIATVLRRRRRPADGETPHTYENENEPFVEWEITRERCAIKEMLWEGIRQRRRELAEDPIEEINAMQFMVNSLLPQEVQVNPETLQNTMRECHVLLPIDVIQDERYLYSIMPYCNGGDMFGLLDESTKFNEPQARYWIRQILQGLQTLQYMGVCHRDMSLENVLFHDESCYIMDFGMCFRVPFTNIPVDSTDFFPPDTRGERQLVVPSGTMGKWNYMSPEIARNREPFDGFAIDLWAVGVMLFTMVTGMHPWDKPDRVIDRFRYMTGGYLVQILTEWNLGLTPALMDLLQKMLWFYPNDRLSLEQVLEHPWMQGEVQAPTPRPPWFNH